MGVKEEASSRTEDVSSIFASFDPSNPLRGVVICCTSIPPEQRVRTNLPAMLPFKCFRRDCTDMNTQKQSDLAAKVEEMGGQHKYDLTSEVTHLVVADYDTPKYRYVAKERPDVKPMTPEWIEAVRLLWMHDHEIDRDALEKQYTLPTFSTLKICMTGFQDRSYSPLSFTKYTDTLTQLSERT
jgi:hypothetical protein